MIAALALLLAAQDIPRAVIADPPRDSAHPARNEQLLVPSGGVGMNAVLMHASGAGPHPLFVLFHGLPGNERNLDLAQAVRRAGWDVLTLTYRGAWGSPGRFSIAHAIEDANATAAFLRRPGTAARYGFDTRRIVFAGHSMGGFAAMEHAARDPALAGLVVIDGWDVGSEAAGLRKGDAAARMRAAEQFDDLGNALVGADAASLAREVLAAPPGWRLTGIAPKLAGMPVLVIGAHYAGAVPNRAIAEAVKASGGKRVRFVEIDSDHAFSDHRIALAGEIVGWLEGIAR